LVKAILKLREEIVDEADRMRVKIDTNPWSRTDLTFVNFSISVK
jgi:hypothetical protein